MFQVKVTNLPVLQEAAQQLLNYFPGPRVFAFYGAMGSGKTTFIKAICHELGSENYVTSPTFALINEYTTSNGQTIYHFDFYRIKSTEEAFDLGYEDYLYSGNYCFIEWPEKIAQLLPEGIIKVRIDEEDDGSRLIRAEQT